MFGQDDPRNMPRYFFFGHLALNFETALKADVSKQNFTVAPRSWYVDATFRCEKCQSEFCFTNTEQKVWYEDFRFYVDSRPNHCLACRKELREFKSLRQDYDRDIAAAIAGDDLDTMVRLVRIIDLLCERGDDVPDRMLVNRRRLARQIARLDGPDVRTDQ